MSVRNIRTTHPKARKRYICRACEDLREGWSVDDILKLPKLNEEEREVLRKALVDDGGYILPGEVYECQFNESDGDTYSWRAKTEVLRIANDHNLLSQDD